MGAAWRQDGDKRGQRRLKVRVNLSSDLLRQNGVQQRSGSCRHAEISGDKSRLCTASAHALRGFRKGVFRKPCGAFTNPAENYVLSGVAYHHPSAGIFYTFQR